MQHICTQSLDESFCLVLKVQYHVEEIKFNHLDSQMADVTDGLRTAIKARKFSWLFWLSYCNWHEKSILLPCGYKLHSLMLSHSYILTRQSYIMDNRIIIIKHSLKNKYGRLSTIKLIWAPCPEKSHIKMSLT